MLGSATVNSGIRGTLYTTSPGEQGPTATSVRSLPHARSAQRVAAAAADRASTSVASRRPPAAAAVIIGGESRRAASVGPERRGRGLSDVRLSAVPTRRTTHTVLMWVCG
jgi:hypothetical protein